MPDMDEKDVVFEQVEDDNYTQTDEQLLWTHQVLTDFEGVIDELGIETIMFLMSKEHEDILSAWIKRGVDISNRTKQ